MMKPHMRGSAAAVQAKIWPRSPYTLLTPYCAGISARSFTHSMRPVRSHCAAPCAGVPPPAQR
jgi:hypothetical protein